MKKNSILSFSQLQKEVCKLTGIEPITALVSEDSSSIYNSDKNSYKVTTKMIQDKRKLKKIYHDLKYNDYIFMPF